MKVPNKSVQLLKSLLESLKENGTQEFDKISEITNKNND